MAFAGLCRRWPRSHNPCFGSKAPNRIKPVDLIDRTYLHVRRILALAQCRRDARHHRRWDASDTTRNRTMNMAAENTDHPSGVLQSLPQRVAVGSKSNMKSFRCRQRSCVPSEWSGRAT